jgi:hypothetical protein
MNKPDPKTLPIFSRSQDGGEGEDATYKVHLTENVAANRCTRLARGLPDRETFPFIRRHAFENNINDFIVEGQMGRLAIYTYEKDVADIICIGSTTYKEMGLW